MRSVGAVFAALCLAWPSISEAQGTAWQTAHQSAVWLNATVDHAITERTALWFDANWRRMEWGREPQQLLIRPGVQFTLRPGVRVGAGYTYAATAPYGESPNAVPTREHRGWQQLALAHRVASVGLSYRVRVEQRWMESVADGPRPSVYQARARFQGRAQLPLARLPAGTLSGFAFKEYFLPIGHSDAEQVRLQNRAGVGMSLPLDARQRIDVSYMHHWNRITPRSTHEINHTLVIGWVWTASR